MTSNWQPELEDQTTEQQAGGFIYHLPQKQSQLEYQVTCHVVLEDSDTQTWGMARNTEGDLLRQPGEGELVGRWSRSPVDGLIHVFLETPIMALVDKATQRFAEYAEMRREKALSSPKSGKTRAPRTPTPAPIPSEELTTISNLRKLLGK